MTMINNTPKMMTIREIAKTGFLPEHSLRQMAKQGRLPAIYKGPDAVILLPDYYCFELYKHLLQKSFFQFFPCS